MIEGNANEAVRRVKEESPVWAVVLLSALAILIVIGYLISHGMAGFSPKDPHYGFYLQWVNVLGVIVTLGIFSVLYQENPVFRFLEHIFIGLAAGYGLVITWFEFIYPNWYVLMMPQSLVQKTAEHDAGGGQWWLFFGLLIGLLFYTVYFPKLAWMNRFALMIAMGLAAGAVLQQFMGTMGPQIVASFKAPITGYSLDGAPPINNIAMGPHLWIHPFSLVFLFVLICALAYFFFSIEHRTHVMRQPANIGRYFLMITLGAIFGTTVMGRFSLLIARLQFLLDTLSGWWHLLVH